MSRALLIQALETVEKLAEWIGLDDEDACPHCEKEFQYVRDTLTALKDALGTA